MREVPPCYSTWVPGRPDLVTTLPGVFFSNVQPDHPWLVGQMQVVARRLERVSRAYAAVPQGPTSWFTASLVAVITLVMVVEVAIADHGLRWMVDTFGLHAGQTEWDSPLFLFTLVSSQFLHGDGSHFFFNALLLLLVGATLEQRIGWRNTLWIWFLGGIFSGIAHVAYMPDAERALIGASGGISVLLGAALVIGASVGIPVRLRRGGRPLFTLTLPMVIAAWLTFQVISFVQFLIVSPEPGIAYWVHLAGFAFGAFAATTLVTTSSWRLTGRSFGVNETASAGD